MWNQLFEVQCQKPDGQVLSCEKTDKRTMQRDSHYWACISSYMLAGWCVDITFSFNQQPNEMESWFRPPLAYIPVYKDNKSQVYKMTQFSLATKNWITNLKLVLYCSQSETILVVKTCHNAKHFFCFHFYFFLRHEIGWTLWYLYKHGQHSVCSRGSTAKNFNR